MDLIHCHTLNSFHLGFICQHSVCNPKKKKKRSVLTLVADLTTLFSQFSRWSEIFKIHVVQVSRHTVIVNDIAQLSM